VVLVGDAACCLDPITGEGVALALQSAESLVRSVVAGDLGHYRTAQRRLIRSAARVNDMVLLLERSPRLRARVVRGLAARPELFQVFLGARRGPTIAAAGAVVRLGWQLLAVAR
jgi:flavin-dependent dehydrogenase